MRLSAPLLCLLFATASLAAQAPFFARPPMQDEGGAMVFQYHAAKAGAVPLTEIASWKWDFDGDGTWDEERSAEDADSETGLPIGGAGITTTWHAVYDSSHDGDNDGIITLTPKLQITTTGGQTITQTGVSENVSGLSFDEGGTVDPLITVRKRGIGNAVLALNFSANPRLARPATDKVRFYSDTVFTEDTVGGTITSYAWNFGGGTAVDGTTLASANPVVTFSTTGSYTVALTVTYSHQVTASGGTQTQTGTLTETKHDFIRIRAVPADLELGRAYRRGFPEEYGWEDILKAYTAQGAIAPAEQGYKSPTHIYFHHLEDAFFTQQANLLGDEDNADKRQQLGEITNELLQGQSMVANQRLIEALRIKYPRIAKYDPNDPPEDLPTPAGAREETAAIDTALLDYHAAIQYAAAAVRDYGTDILRSRAPEGAEPFPQFPLYLTFEDPSLSQAPVPIKNEYAQLTTALERMALGRVEKAKQLFRLSSQDATARPEALAEAKTTGTQAYLGMALLAAGQSESDFAQNGGNSLLAHVKNARDLFEMINAGVNPLGNDGSFIPNESFAATYQDATEAVADAREAEINARQEERTWDHYQAELRNEQLAQRTSYLTPLRLLTGLDPALYNNLQTVDDQRDFRNTVQSRVNALMEDYPNANPAIVGELGAAVVNVLDSRLSVQRASNSLDNVFRRVDLLKWKDAKISRINMETRVTMTAVDFLFSQAEGLKHSIVGLANSIGFTQAAAALEFKAMTLERLINEIGQMRIDDVKLEAEIKGILLEVGNLAIDIQKSKNQLNQSQLALDNQLTRMDRLIEDLAATRDSAADLYFMDPSFRIVVSDAMRRAEGELDYAIDRLYRLAKTLEYEWTEGYQNPVTIPVQSFEPASLENPLFDKFTQTDSLFFIRGADEAKDYLDALKAWDSKLRRINVSSVRGPNHSGPVSAEPISLRETILNLKPDASRGYTLDDSIRDFRNYLENQRKANYYNTANPSLSLQFQTTIEDNRFFPATGSRWNMRIHSIRADVYAESGFSDKQVCEIDLVQTGTVSLRRFWASPPTADDLMKLTFNAPDLDRTAFAVTFPARINGATGGRPASEFENLGLKDRPVAATNWILSINTEGPTNHNIDFSKVKDILIYFTYTFGNPEEFPNF